LREDPISSPNKICGRSGARALKVRHTLELGKNANLEALWPCLWRASGRPSSVPYSQSELRTVLSF
jgi:hypothetical protein